MADMFVQASFAFQCSSAEMALLEEGFQASYDLSADCMAPDAQPSPDFAALFPGLPGDPWSGFLSMFADPDFPSFGADLQGGNAIGETKVTAVITAECVFEPEPVAHLIQRCCQATLATEPIGFEWSVTCSKMRIGEFGGGWCAIFPDRIEFETTAEVLSQALSGGII